MTEVFQTADARGLTVNSYEDDFASSLAAIDLDEMAPPLTLGSLYYKPLSRSLCKPPVFIDVKRMLNNEADGVFIAPAK